LWAGSCRAAPLSALTTKSWEVSSCVDQGMYVEVQNTVTSKKVPYLLTVSVTYFLGPVTPKQWLPAQVVHSASGVIHSAGSVGTYPDSTGHTGLTSGIEVFTWLPVVFNYNLFASDVDNVSVSSTFAAIVKAQSVPVSGRQDKIRGPAIGRRKQMSTCLCQQSPVVADYGTGRVNTHKQALHTQPHQKGKTMTVMVAIVCSELLLGVRRAPPTHLRTIHENDPRGEPTNQALHFPPLRPSRSHNDTRQHKKCHEQKKAMKNIVSDRRRRPAGSKGNGPDGQRPLVSPTQTKESQTIRLMCRTHPAGRVSQVVHLHRELQPRVHRTLPALSSQLHNTFRLL